jgi:hypothetical protein
MCRTRTGAAEPIDPELRVTTLGLLLEHLERYAHVSMNCRSSAVGNATCTEPRLDRAGVLADGLFCACPDVFQTLRHDCTGGMVPIRR